MEELATLYTHTHPAKKRVQMTLALFFLYVSSSTKWTSLPRVSSPWPARSTHAACATTTHVHIIGGYGEFSDVNYKTLDDTWSFLVEGARYDKRTRAGWRRATETTSGCRPNARMCATASPWGADIVLFGGRDDTGVAYDDIWRMCVVTGAWSKLASSLPGGADERLVSCAMACGVVLLRTDRLGVVVYDSDGVRAQPTTGDRPRPGHSRAMAAIDGRYLLVAGGSVCTSGGLSDVTYMLDTHAWHWTCIGPSEFTPRMGAAAVGLGDGRVVLFGGATYDLDHPTGMIALDDTWIFDLDYRWKQVHTASPPPARYGASLCRVGATVVLHGGWNPDGPSFADTHVVKFI